MFERVHASFEMGRQAFGVGRQAVDPGKKGLIHLLLDAFGALGSDWLVFLVTRHVEVV